MKTLFKHFTLWAVATLVATGCADDTPNYGPTDPTISGDNCGYLTAEGLKLRVIVDSKTDIQPDDTKDETKTPKSSTALSSRAEGDLDVNRFLVDITDSEGTSHFSGSYAELKALLAEPMPLKVGTYTLSVRSEQTIPAAEWEHPSYAATKSFSILKAQNTSLGEIVCKLQNIKVSLLVSADLADLLSADTQASITIGGNTLSFGTRETRAGYYQAVETTNTLDFVLSGSFADSGSPVQFTKTIENVKAGEWRKITLVIAYSDKGEIKFDIKVDSFIQDEIIEVNSTKGVWEPIYDEPTLINPPTISWTDHEGYLGNATTAPKPFQLKATMFDATGNCTEPFTFNLATAAGCASFQVTITSTNSTFIDALKVMSLAETFDLCKINPQHAAYTTLSLLGFPLGDDLINATAKSFDIGGAMPLLYTRPGYDGTHTFAFTITDNEGQQMQASLAILVDRNNENTGGDGEPTIVWSGNYIDGTPYDIDREEPYLVSEDMKVIIDITAPAGIASFQVDIISDALPPKDLESVGIPASFDLANIKDEALATQLGTPYPDGFGFPVNEEIKNRVKPTKALDVSVFMGVLKYYKGIHNFQLTLKDNKGRTIVKTVKLQVNQ